MRTYPRKCKTCGIDFLADWRRRDYCPAHRPAWNRYYAKWKWAGTLPRGTCLDCGKKINRQSTRCKPCATAARNRKRKQDLDAVGQPYIAAKGPAHGKYMGDTIKPSSGYGRLHRTIPMKERCEVCGKPAKARHHRDENPLNNDPRNIAHLCGGCHRKAHPNPRAFGR